MGVSPATTDIGGENQGVRIPADVCPLWAIAKPCPDGTDWVSLLIMCWIAIGFCTKRCAVLTGLALAWGCRLAAAEPGLKEILDRMVQMDHMRAQLLDSYTCIRIYHLENKRFNKHAQMVVRATCRLPGGRNFEILSETGSETIRRRVFRKLLDAELEASESRHREEVKIIPDNYDFRWLGEENLGGRRTYLLEVTPKRASHFSIVGKIWLDAEDLAIARIEGVPAKRPSIWIRRTVITQQYAKFGPFWLPVYHQSNAEALVFGLTEFQILYQNYEIRTRSETATMGGINGRTTVAESKTVRIPRLEFFH